MGALTQNFSVKYIIHLTSNGLVVHSMLITKERGHDFLGESYGGITIYN